MSPSHRGETVDTLALLNVNAANHPRADDRPDRWRCLRPDHQMIAPISDSSWYMWFFEPIARKDFLVATLPPYGSAAGRVELNDPLQQPVA